MPDRIHLLLILLFLALPAAAGDYLVTYDPGVSRAQALPDGYRARSLGMGVDLISGADPAAVAALPGVATVEADRLMHSAATPVTNDPYYGWHQSRIRLPEFGGGAGVNIAVLDSGYNVDHSDITYSSTRNVVTGTDATWINNEHGMGTSGVIGAIADNAVAAAGVAHGVDLMGVQVSELNSGAAYLSDLVRGLNYAAENRARIVSASFGGLPSSVSFSSAAEEFRAMYDGQTVVSAGNDGVDASTTNSPALTVAGATDQDDNRASWSNYGTQLDIMAPGVGIWSLDADGAKRWSGTSFSAPMVAGVLGLILASDPGITMEEAQQRLFGMAEDLGPPGYDIETGWGRLDMGTSVPVPAAIWLFGSGLLGLIAVARRR